MRVNSLGEKLMHHGLDEVCVFNTRLKKIIVDEAVCFGVHNLYAWRFD